MNIEPKFRLGQAVECTANDTLPGPQLKIGSTYTVSENWRNPVTGANCISVAERSQQWAYFEDNFIAGDEKNIKQKKVRQRRTLIAADLTSAALIQSLATGKVYRLGPPKKRNVNKNVVNHCQLYYRSNGKLLSTEWYNLTNLREFGYKLYVPEGAKGKQVSSEPAPACPGDCVTCERKEVARG